MQAIWLSMVPMTLQFIIVMIASAINDRLQWKLDYVEEERRVLQEQLDTITAARKPSLPPISAGAWPQLASCCRRTNVGSAATS